MIAESGTAIWFARHEWRLAWRDWLAMMGGGKPKRLRRAVFVIAIFIVFMHFVAYWTVGGFAGSAPDKATLLAISVSAMLSWLLMISQAMETVTRAFYARSDLDLILASPADATKIFAVRIAAVAASMALMALPLAAPFIDILIARGGWRWLGAYGLLVAMAATATAFAVAFSVALFRIVGPKRTRFVAQVAAAVIGAAFVIGLQIAAIQSYGTIARTTLLQSQALLARLPDLDSLIWWPARAALGDGLALIAVVSLGLILLVLTIGAVAPRFGAYAVTASSVDTATTVRRGRPGAFHPTSPRRALRTKEWLLLRRDPWLVSQTLMQMLYLIPPAVLLWRSFNDGSGAYQLLVPVLVMAAGQLAGGLAWLAISGEDAPDLVASAPIPSGFITGAKIEAVIGVVAVVFTPLVAALAIVSPWHALVAAAGILVAAAAATAIQLWFRTQAKRSQFRRRQVSSRFATFAEAFSSIGWAATAAVAASSLSLAVAPAVLALLVVMGTWLMSPSGIVAHSTRRTFL